MPTGKFLGVMAGLSVEDGEGGVSVAVLGSAAGVSLSAGREPLVAVAGELLCAVSVYACLNRDTVFPTCLCPSFSGPMPAPPPTQ